MLEQWSNTLSSLKLTLIGGFFLALSLGLMLAKQSLPIDPAWVTVLISGLPLLYIAIQRLIQNRGISKISSALLISIAMIAAAAIGDVFAAGEVAFIMAIGGILEERTAERAKRGLHQLINLAPQQGRRISGGREAMIPVETIQSGDQLRILPGEAIPVDGEIIAGHTSVDQSIMTGESLPVDKTLGDQVFGGTINRFGSIDIVATRVGADGSLQKLIRMVQSAEEKQAPMQRITDRWASWLVPLALAIAILTYWITRDAVRAVTILVVFCPCALVLATPTAIMAAIGQATKHGVIIKSGEALEHMGKVDTLAFDKTGTLTFGNLEVSEVIAFTPEWDAEQILRWAASAEAKSEHPLAKAIVKHAETQGLILEESQEFYMLVGQGIRTIIAEREVVCGNRVLLENRGIYLNDAQLGQVEQAQQRGQAVVLVAIDGEPVGFLALSDVLRPEAKRVVAQLSQMQTQTALLTGDNQRTAKHVAAMVGIDQLYHELLPEEKVQQIEALEQQGHTVAMVGDGVNDAPALKIASVGIAMGSMGSDIAVEAADIALMGDDIGKLPYLKRLSNATVQTIRLSIVISLLINFAAIILSLMGILKPISGALVHNAGSILVVLIASFLYDRDFQTESVE